MLKVRTLYTEDDGEVELPFKWEICGQCRGHGTSSRYLGAFTADQMREDPEFAEDYMNDEYDRTCETCGGSGKVKVLDRTKTPADQLEAYDAQQRDLEDVRSIERQERLMEGGWRDMEGYGIND